MSPIDSAARAVARAAEAATGAAGAVGGAVVSGVVGGVQGTVSGMKAGLSSGSHSPPAAALTLAAIGALGLVEWPVIVGIGGTALVLRQLNQRSEAATAPAPRLTAVDDPPARAGSSGTSSGTAAGTTSRAAKKSPARTPRKSATAGSRTAAKK